MKQSISRLMILALVPAVLTAGITYDPTNHCLVIVNYPEEQPATPQNLLAADRENRWGKVSYDPSNDTYTIAAAIWIGDDRGFSTYFQIGEREHPQVTLVMKGSLWVRPAAKGVARSDGSPSIMNGLTSGDPQNKSIAPRILFDCSKPGEHGLYAGLRLKNLIKNTSVLKMYNTTVGPVASTNALLRWGDASYGVIGKANEYHTAGCYVSVLRLENCRFSDFTGPMFYGVDTVDWSHIKKTMLKKPTHSITACRFENGVCPLSGFQYLSDCVFTNMVYPVRDSGSIYLCAFNCVFEGNQYNWNMSGYAARDVNLIDCRIFPQSKPMQMKKNATPDKTIAIPEYPSVRIMKSLRIKVVDAHGAPVPLVAVEAIGNGPIYRNSSETGLDGLTGSDPQKDAIVVTVKQYTATDDPEKPAVTENFDYEVKASDWRRAGSKTLRASEFESPMIITVTEREP